MFELGAAQWCIAAIAPAAHWRAQTSIAIVDTGSEVALKQNVAEQELLADSFRQAGGVR
jgi:hypothetical protein